MQRAIGLLDVDAVYVSHLHADHCTDLVGMSYARRYHPDGMPPPLPLYGPAGLADRLCAVFEVPPPDRLRQVYDEPRRLASEYLGGDFRDFCGEWRLEPAAGGTTHAELDLRIDYEHSHGSGLPIPREWDPSARYDVQGRPVAPP